MPVHWKSKYGPAETARQVAASRSMLSRAVARKRERVQRLTEAEQELDLAIDARLGASRPVGG